MNHSLLYFHLTTCESNAGRAITRHDSGRRVPRLHTYLGYVAQSRELVKQSIIFDAFDAAGNIMLSGLLMFPLESGFRSNPTPPSVDANKS